MSLATIVAVTAAAVALVVGVAAVLAVTVRDRRRLRTELDAARADLDALRSRVELLGGTAGRPSRPPAGRASEHLITSLHEPTEPDAPVPVSEVEPLTAGRFVSVALGESLVRLLSLGYGVRRAASAENRNRIRFEMRRELRRSRKQRRRDLKAARRTRRGADVAEDAA